VSTKPSAYAQRSFLSTPAVLTFVDAAGLAALVRARRAASEAGVAFRVSDASPALRYVAEEAGFRALLPDE
jgi:anti-anti-sigma regulatory factor